MSPEFDIVSIGTGIGGFVLGYIIRPIISTEYERYRESQIQHKKEKENWKVEVKGLLSELRLFAEDLRGNNRPDIETWLDKLESFEERLYKKGDLPPNVDEKLDEKLMGLSGHCSAYRTVISDLAYETADYNGGKMNVPHPSRYESVYINEEDETIDCKRVLREMCSNISDKIIELVNEATTMIESVN